MQSQQRLDSMEVQLEERQKQVTCLEDDIMHARKVIEQMNLDLSRT
jgi:hypothetical protein